MTSPGLPEAAYSSLRDTDRERAEQALAASERRFRALIEHAEDGIVLYDRELRAVYRSPAAQRMGDTVYPGDRESMDALVRALRDTPGASASFRCRRICADGAPRWVEGVMTNRFDDPMVAALVVNFRDVHDRVSAERLLRLEHAVAAALARAHGENDGVRAVIREVCEALGWMAGRYFCAEAGGTLRYREGWGQDTQAARDYLAQARKVSYLPGEGLTGLVWQSGEPLWSASVAHDPRATGRMGSVISGGAIVLPVSSQGERLGVLSFVRSEATAPDQELLQALAVMASQVGHFVRAKRSEAVLRESEARFRSLVELSSDWYWEQDEEFRFTRFGGGEAPEALGKRRWELPIEPVSQTWTAHRATLEAHQPFHGFEYSRDGEDGERRYVEVNGEPMFDAAGAFRGYRGLAKDITGRRRVQQEREKLGRMYASLSAVNELVARAETEQELLQVACEIAVSSGEFRYALVRLADEAQGFAPVVAFAGPQQKPRISRPLDLRPGSPDAGLLAVRAYREDRNLTDEDDVRIAGAYPLHRGGRCIGILLLVGQDRRAFTGEMGELLARMARNVSQGLDRLRADEELRRFRLAVDESAEMIALVDCHTLRYLDVNAAMCKALGYSREELLAMHPFDVLPVTREQLMRNYEDIANGTGSPSWVTEYRCKDGSIMPIESSRRVMRAGGRLLMVAIARDIGERLAREDDLQRVTRMYASLSNLNELVARAASAQELLQRACEVVASSGDFVRAAVRLLDRARGATQFVAASGERAASLAALDISLAGDPGPSLVVEAIRSNQPVITRDYVSDPRTERARRLAQVTGARSAGVFPLRQQGECVGVLILHGRDPGSFDGEMQLLLERMAGNLSYGLESLESQARFGQTFELAASGMALVSVEDRRFLRVNRHLCDMLGYSAGELTRLTGRDISHPEDNDVVNAQRPRLYAGEIDNIRLEKRYLRKGGTVVWVLLTVALARDANGAPKYEILVVEDITARKRSEQALRGIVQASAEPLLLVRRDGTTQFANPAAEALFGRSAKELEGAPLGLPVADGRPAEVEIVLPDGGVRPAEMQYAATELEGEELLVVSLHDLSERKRYESHIEHLANHDALTSLPNRTLLGDRVEQAIAHARRNGGHVGLMFVDLDQFKLVNDSWGHATGDRLLLEVARRLQATVRDGDSVARLGGDEFVVLLPDLARADSTSVVARKVAEALETPLAIDGREMRITASIGIALFPDDGDSLDALLQCADAAMYRAKDAGRNGYQYYSADMGAQARARVEIESGLRLALATDQLRLHYQPQVGLERGEVRGFEALMRWEHPSRGMIPPADFIPVAEESGLIMPMGDWALLTACREAAAWAAGGYGSLRIAVNLSARQFWRGSVTESVRKALGESGLPPSQLEIEITESVVARDLQNVMLQLEQLRRLGVSIAIDDFGTGYSSLAYLRSLPINKLKIDKSFIKGIPGDREATALAGEIIRLAHILSLEVVAEGVETEAQAGLLRQAGCEAMQGYLFARPMPGPECAALLRTGRRLRFDG